VSFPAPVTFDDLVSGCARYLLGCPTAVAAVGAGGDPSTPLLTQDEAAGQDELAGQVAACVSHAGPWGEASPMSTLENQRLQLELLADPLRDSTGEPAEPAETRRRLFAVYAVFDALLHRPQGGVQWWGTVRTTDCVRLGGLSAYPVPAGGGLWRGVAYYGVSLG
jgi:hypothetical protein